jgi:hypothetical protein
MGMARNQEINMPMNTFNGYPEQATGNHDSVHEFGSALNSLVTLTGLAPPNKETSKHIAKNLIKVRFTK